MEFIVFLFGMLLSPLALADSTALVVPSNQNLAVVDYFSNGRQSGCGLRATGETKDDLWLNVLITVFRKETGAAFGVIKVVARKVNTKNGAPVLKDGKITYATLGRIRRASIETDSGKKPVTYKNDESSHGDAYMVNSEFASTVELLVAMSQEKFKVGLSRNESGPDETFQFDTRLDQDEVGKLSVCMKNLRATMEENKNKEIL